MSEHETNARTGANGATRRGRDPAERMLLRCVRAGWLVPDDQLQEVRDSVISLVHNAADDRTRVMAAKLLAEVEVAHVNSVNAVTPDENTDTEAAEDESGESETFD